MIVFSGYSCFLEQHCLLSASTQVWFYREAWLLGAVILSTKSTDTLTCLLSESRWTLAPCGPSGVLCSWSTKTAENGVTIKNRHPACISSIHTHALFLKNTNYWEFKDGNHRAPNQVLLSTRPQVIAQVACPRSWPWKQMRPSTESIGHVVQWRLLGLASPLK